MEGEKIMNTNEIIRLLRDFQNLRFDLFSESQISALGKKINTLYETTAKDVKFQELDSKISELSSHFYPDYFKDKLKAENVVKPAKIKDLTILEKYFEKLKSVNAKYASELNRILAQLKKIKRAQDDESIQILLQCTESELADLELITSASLLNEISMYRQTNLAANESKKTLNDFKAAEKETLKNFKKADKKTLSDFKKAEKKTLRDFKKAEQETLKNFKKAEKKILSMLSQIKSIRETGLT